MKKLLFVAPCLSFAGAEKILLWVASSMSKKGYEVHVLNLNLVDNNSGFRIDNQDGIIIHKRDNNPRRGLNNITRIRYIITLARQISADLIISFTRYPCILSVVASKIARKPVLISERGDPGQFTHGLRNRIEQTILNFADACVFQIEGAKKYYSKSLQKRSIIIPNPIEIKEHMTKTNYSEGKKNIISIGRFDNVQKRYDVMLKGFNGFSRIHPDYKLLLYGSGPDESKIRIWVQEMNLQGKVIFMGLTRNVVESLSNSGIFLITSDFEGIPNALLEAMAAGLAVISTDCSPGGAKMLIEDHNNGLLVPVRNPEAIKNALCEYAEDEQLSQKCGENARKVLIRFKPEKIMLQWNMFIDSVLNKRGK